jgi:hypothetical protein
MNLKRYRLTILVLFTGLLLFGFWARTEFHVVNEFDSYPSVFLAADYLIYKYRLSNDCFPKNTKDLMDYSLRINRGDLYQEFVKHKFKYIRIHFARRPYILSIKAPFEVAEIVSNHWEYKQMKLD